MFGGGNRKAMEQRMVQYEERGGSYLVCDGGNRKALEQRMVQYEERGGSY